MISNGWNDVMVDGRGPRDLAMQMIAVSRSGGMMRLHSGQPVDAVARGLAPAMQEVDRLLKADPATAAEVLRVTAGRESTTDPALRVLRQVGRVEAAPESGQDALAGREPGQKPSADERKWMKASWRHVGALGAAGFAPEITKDDGFGRAAMQATLAAVQARRGQV